MSRTLEMEIFECSECPWCRYDGYYSIGKDSGYDCYHPNSAPTNQINRIVEDWEVNNSNNKKPKGWPPIPDWCPLPYTH